MGILLIALIIWGIIQFWGTYWSIAMLIFMALELLFATYRAGAQVQAKIDAEPKEKEPEAEESIFAKFFKKGDEDD